MELIKNNRFRTGSTVDIYHTPIWEGNSISILDVSVGNDWTIFVNFDRSFAGEQVAQGDICAFSFGVGIITTPDPTISNSLHVEFPKSMFPDTDVKKWVGSDFQHTLIFAQTGKVAANFTVAQYKEEVEQATWGYAKSVYNLQTKAELVLAPIRLVEDGTLSALMYSKGYVLKSCDETDYEPTTSWDTEFPIELSGTSIDPIYRRAYLTKRNMTSKGRRSKATMTFRLIG